MKVKLAILDSDINYLKRLLSVFSTKYSDKLEVYSFTDQERALDALNVEKIDVFIADESFIIDERRVGQKCAFAYFVASPDIQKLNDQTAICKFQKADLIHKAILNLFSERAGNLAVMKVMGNEAEMIVFTSPCGGTGTSCVAAAYAARMAQQGKRALYLNLEKISTANVFFHGEGAFSMSDVIFALKGKKTNMALRLESCVKCDPCGVYYFEPAKVALERLELTGEEEAELIAALRASGSYDVVVVDIDFEISDSMIALYEQADRVIWVSDGTQTANAKIEGAYAALRIIEKGKRHDFFGKLNLLYNKFSNKTGCLVACPGLSDVGGVPKLERAMCAQVLDYLKNQAVLDNIHG